MISNPFEQDEFDQHLSPIVARSVGTSLLQDCYDRALITYEQSKEIAAIKKEKDQIRKLMSFLKGGDMSVYKSFCAILRGREPGSRFNDILPDLETVFTKKGRLEAELGLLLSIFVDVVEFQ